MTWTQLARLGGYLHQDWPLDYPDADAAVRAFASDLTDPERSSALEELQRLRAVQSEDGLRLVFVDQLRVDYWPPGDGLTFGQWVDRLEAILRESR